MIKYLSAVALASLAIGLAPAATAPVRLPNPCRTFTAASADALVHAARHARLPEQLTSTTQPIRSRTCTVRHGGRKLTVVTQYQAGGFGMGLHCYQRPRLGPYGVVCVSAVRSGHFSFVVFRKPVGQRRVYVSDGINQTLPDQGRALFTFALAQRKLL